MKGLKSCSVCDISQKHAPRVLFVPQKDRKVHYRDKWWLGGFTATFSSKNLWDFRQGHPFTAGGITIVVIVIKLLQETTPSVSPTDVQSTHKRLTVEDMDADGLLLLNGLCVGEACVTNVVISGIFHHHVGEIEVTVQALRDTAALWKPLEICGCRGREREREGVQEETDR